jgi:hypothetical protein
MKDLRFRVWHIPGKKMYYRGYQKFLHALLCEDDGGDNDGRGRPVMRAPYSACVFLESTNLLDKKSREIYEGDFVRVVYKGRVIEDVVPEVPDMFGSKKMHPLDAILKKHGITGNPENLDVEVLGNEYETPDALKRTSS